MKPEANGFALGVALGVACSAALPTVLLPSLLGLTHVGAWRMALVAAGAVGTVGIGLWSYRRVRHAPGAPETRDSIHNIPFALAQTVFAFAVLMGTLTFGVLWMVGHRVGLATSAGVIAYLLAAVPVLGVYLFGRRRLSAFLTATATPIVPAGQRQSLRLRVLLAFQLPLLVSATGIVLVEHSDKTAYHQAVKVYHQDQRLRLYDRVQGHLPNASAREALAAAVGEHIPFQVDDALRLPEVPYSLRWSMLVLLGLVVLLSAYVGRWLSRDVTGDISAIRDALRRLTTEDRRSVTPTGVAMQETAEVVAAFRAALIGFEAQRSRMQQAQTERAQAERAKARFLAHLSHELKSPLNSILGFSELLLAELDGPVTPQQREYLSVIWRSGDALLRFIIGVLDLARLEDATDQEGSPSHSPVDATTLVRALQETARLDPLGAVSITLPPLDADATEGVRAMVDPALISRATILVAGILMDTMVKGVVEVNLDAKGEELILSVRAQPGEVELADLERLNRDWREWLKAPLAQKGQASTIPLRLLSRLQAVGECRFEIEMEEEWPVVRLALTAP